MRVSKRPALLALAGLLLAAGIAAVGSLALFGGSSQPPFTSDSPAPRPHLQRVLVNLVSGPAKLAPGAVAYVSGPHGTWLAAAGVADTKTREPMPLDARMRLESVSKIYTATVILQLAQEGKLRLTDTVSRWLPGLLPYGNRITIRQLLTMMSGLVDNNDLRNATESEQRTYLGRVKDARLRQQLVAIAARVEKDRSVEFAPIWWIRYAASQPLRFAPGWGYHYSNIGYDILGLIAARAGGKPLPVLYRERIFEPLGLRDTAFDPQGPIRGPHAHGYGIDPDGRQYDATDWHSGVGAEGGIVANAKDTATFLTGLMRGKLLDRAHLMGMESNDLWLGGSLTGCAEQAYGWSGGGDGFKTEVWVADGGTRVAVLLLNARHWDTAQTLADADAHDAMADLYCHA